VQAEQATAWRLLVVALGLAACPAAGHTGSPDAARPPDLPPASSAASSVEPPADREQCHPVPNVHAILSAPDGWFTTMAFGAGHLEHYVVFASGDVLATSSFRSPRWFALAPAQLTAFRGLDEQMCCDGFITGSGIGGWELSARDGSERAQLASHTLCAARLDDILDVAIARDEAMRRLAELRRSRDPASCCDCGVSRPRSLNESPRCVANPLAKGCY
jgi:hypothetical protein